MRKNIFNLETEDINESNYVRASECAHLEISMQERLLERVHSSNSLV